MKFFDFFRKKKAPAPKKAAPSVMVDGVMVTERVAAILPRMAAIARPVVRITATPSDSLFLFDSKFGGHPWWPAGKPFPTDSYGHYMYPLAQLNFSQIPHLEGYPEKGLLQFYIAADDLYGADFDAPEVQKNFRVVYYEDFTEPALENFSFLDEQPRESDIPVHRQMGLSFSLGKDYFSYNDVRYPRDAAEEIMAGDNGGPEDYSVCEEELIEAFPDTGHRIGGYAYFTQTDPREDKPASYNDWVLLLQIDSQDADVCWGDYGVGNFFIHPEALMRKEFSRVLYNWDCT